MDFETLFKDHDILEDTELLAVPNALEAKWDDCDLCLLEDGKVVLRVLDLKGAVDDYSIDYVEVVDE